MTLPPDWPVALAVGYGWPPSEIKALTLDEVAFWLDGLEGLRRE